MTDSGMKGDGAGVFDKDAVVRIVNSVLSKFNESDEDIKKALQEELVSLHQIIQELRDEISSIHAKQIQDQHIPSATDELDAVVNATEDATSSIMDSAEKIEGEAEKLEGEGAEKISEEVVKIFEACSFQDITGQRITKVINAIRTIESKVDQLLNVVGASFPGVLDGDSPEDQPAEGDEALMNGPAAPDQQVTQDDIDKILAEFDD